MLNDYNYQPGDIVRVRDRSRDDVMAWYIFRDWADVPPHVRAGRIAILTWCYNGTDSSSWEADICPDPADRDILRDMIAAEQSTNRCNRAVPVTS